MHGSPPRAHHSPDLGPGRGAAPAACLDLPACSHIRGYATQASRGTPSEVSQWRFATQSTIAMTRRIAQTFGGSWGFRLGIPGVITRPATTAVADRTAP